MPTLTQRFIVVTGLPASGKSTVGRAIATGLGLPFFDKDEFLESLFAANVPGSHADRNTLSRIADESFRERAMASERAVLASWWKHPRSSSGSGTPTRWLASGGVLEVYCDCPPAIAVERFLMRKRHAAHLDHLRSRDQLMAQFTQQAALGPLGLGSLIRVNTTAISQSIDSSLIEQLHLMA